MEKGFWKLLVILAFALFGSLQLEKALRFHYILELYLLMIALLVALVAVLGVGWSKSWGWPLAGMLLSLLTLNALVMFLATRKYFLTFEIVLVVCLAGMIMAVLRSTENDNPLETLPRLQFESGLAKR